MKITKKLISVVLALLMALSCFSLIGSAEDTQNTEHLTEVPEGYVGVYTAEDLFCIRYNLNANYILMNDIDLTESLSDGGEWNIGTGWQPIGEERSKSQYFEGVFDGNNHSIIGLRFCGNTEFSYSGLFGKNKGVIKNFKLEDFTVTGTFTYLGLVCAENSGEIKNIKANGTIKAYFNVGGGICGNNLGVISDCHIDTNTTISNSGDFCYGNICGRNYSFATIENCSSVGTNNIASSGNVGTGSFVVAYTYAGGIAGKNSGTIKSSFNKSDFKATVTASFSWSFSTTITGTKYYYRFSNCDSTTGGIAATNNGTIENCYNAGEISIVGSYSYESGAGYAAQKPSALIGGISGNNTDGNIDCCYNFALVNCNGSFESSAKGGLTASGNPSETSYYLSTNTSSSGTSLTEKMFSIKACFTSFDFENVWFIDSSTGIARPQLINNREAIHEHSYTSEITTPSTHMSEGLMTYTCECGDSYTEVIAKTETHNYESTVTAPTCTEQGFTTYECECGDTYIGDYYLAIGHSWSKWETTVEVTPDTDGEQMRECSVCGEKENRIVLRTSILVTVTDADGNVVKEEIFNEDISGISFEDLEDGEYTLTVEKADYVTREYKITSVENEAYCDVKLHKIGDINGDGKITVLDYTTVLKHVKKTTSLEDYAFKCADVNGDGKISILDYTKILKHVKKTETLW